MREEFTAVGDVLAMDNSNGVVNSSKCELEWSSYTPTNCEFEET
jgi:hypothetical protein